MFTIHSCMIQFRCPLKVPLLKHSSEWCIIIYIDFVLELKILWINICSLLHFKMLKNWITDNASVSLPLCLLLIKADCHVFTFQWSFTEIELFFLKFRVFILLSLQFTLLVDMLTGVLICLSWNIFSSDYNLVLK